MTSINNISSSNTHKPTCSQNNSIFINPVTPFDIHKTIQSLKNINSTGFDGIATKVVKYVSTVISPVLSHIFNLCIENGHFPSILKKDYHQTIL